MVNQTIVELIGGGAKMKLKITKTNVEALTVDASKNYYVWDEELPSFGVVVYKSGCKSFVLYKRIGKGRAARKKLFILGACNVMTPYEARTKAKRISIEASDGRDPTKTPVEFITVAEAWDKYFNSHLAKKKSAEDGMNAYKAYIEPRFANKMVKDLTTEDVAKMIDELGSHSEASANKAKAYLRSSINYVRRTTRELHSLINPCIFVTGYRIAPRRDYVKHDKMPALLDALRREENVYGRAAVLLFILLGQRKTMILSLAWKDVDLDGKRLYWPDTKNSDDHHVPMSKHAEQVIRLIPRLKVSPWVFPAVNIATRLDGRDHLKDIKRSWNRIRKTAGLKGITIHDLRRTMGSWMSQDGESLTVIGELMGHSDPKVTKDHYAHFQDKPLRNALERYGDQVFSINENQLN